MKINVLTLFISLICFPAAAQLVYFEDFEDETDGATSGTATGGTWSRSYSGGGTFSKQDVFLVGNTFTGQSMGGVEGVWLTNVIDISTYGYAIIDISSYTAFTESGDYLTAYYILNNNGSEIPFYSQGTAFASTSSGGSVIVSGTQVQVVVRMFNNNGGDIWGIDDVEINGVSTLYSTNAGGTSTWNTGTTWSTVGFGGAVCTCTPNTLTRVLIGSGYSISIPAASNAIYLEVQSGGALTWSAAADLNIGRGGINVQAGGSISSGASTTAQIDFDEDYATSIVVDGALTIGDIEVNGTPTITVSGGGSINIMDDLLFNDNTTLNSTLSNTITIAGDLNVDATSTLGGTSSIQTGTLTLNAGTTTFSTTGNLTVTSTSNIAGTFVDSNETGTTTLTGLVTVSGTWTTTTITTDGRLIFQGGLTLSGTFNGAAATFNTNDQSLAGAGTYSFSRTVTVTGVTVTNNATVTISSTGADRLAGTGTWVQGNNSTLNYASLNIPITGFQASNTGNTVNYNSTLTQAIRTPATNYYNLTLNNNTASIPAFTVSSNITVINTFNFTNGIVNLGGFTFTLGSSGTASDMNRTASTTTKWMYGGTFTRFWLNATAVSSTAGNLYGLFPLGTSSASSYRPFQITSTANPTATGSVSVTHTDASTATDLSPAFNDGGTNIVRKHDAPFVVAVAGVTGGTYTINATMTGLLAGTLSDIRLAKSNGTTTVTTVGTHQAASGTAPNPTAGRTAVSLANLAGDYRISSSNSTNTPLPVELLSFSAQQTGNSISLSWITATELNNDFFTIEKLNANDGFDMVLKVPGKGTTTEISEYHAVDRQPNAGKNYYRLKQTDFDGKFSYSGIVVVDFTGTIETLNIYPIPARNTDIIIELRSLEPRQEIQVDISNALGATAFRTSLRADENGAVTAILPTADFQKGMYILNLAGTGGAKRKIIIE